MSYPLNYLYAMQMVTLQFQTPQDLTGFRTVLTPDTIFKVNVSELTLTCSCSEKDIAKAMNHFGAKVIKLPDFKKRI